MTSPQIDHRRRPVDILQRNSSAPNAVLVHPRVVDRHHTTPGQLPEAPRYRRSGFLVPSHAFSNHQLVAPPIIRAAS